MKRLQLIFLLLLATQAWGQTRTVGLNSVEPLSNDLTGTQAEERAVAFLTLIGEKHIDRSKLTYALERDVLNPSSRRYEFTYGLHVAEFDSVKGDVRFYSLSSAYFRTANNPKLSPPNLRQIETIVGQTAKAVGLPIDAKRTNFVVYDRNPRGDSDTRGYFAATYQGEGRFLLHMVFDRQTGRLENLIRIPAKTASEGVAKGTLKTWGGP